MNGFISPPSSPFGKYCNVISLESEEIAAVTWTVGKPSSVENALEAWFESKCIIQPFLFGCETGLSLLSMGKKFPYEEMSDWSRAEVMVHKTRF